MGTIIKEVAFLDLTNASAEVLNEIKAIKKVAFLLYNEKFEPYMAKIDFEEVASTLKVTGSHTIINGKSEIDSQFITGIKEPLFLIINGKLTIKPGVSLDLLDQAISGICLNGKIYCPESIQGLVQQKMAQLNGKILTYMDQVTRFESAPTTLDNGYLAQLDADTNLVLTSDVKMFEGINLSLFNEKINTIQFLGSATVSEKYREELSPKTAPGSVAIRYIPEGFNYVEGDLELTDEDLSRYPGGKLYTDGSIYFGNEIEAKDVEENLVALKATEAIYCRKELRKAILSICEPSAKVTSYKGILRAVDGAYTLTQPELEYTPDTITFIVRGVLEVDSNVDPKTLFEKIAHVDNYGVITGSPEAVGVLQTKLRVREGVVESGNSLDIEEESREQEDPSDHVISKVAHLKL